MCTYFLEFHKLVYYNTADWLQIESIMIASRELLGHSLEPKEA